MRRIQSLLTVLGLVLPLSDRADYAVAGIHPAAVPEHRPPGRALVGEGSDAAFVESMSDVRFHAACISALSRTAYFAAG